MKKTKDWGFSLLQSAGGGEMKRLKMMEIAGRDILYIARDLNMNKLAPSFAKNTDTKRDLLYTMDMLEGNRNLPNLLGDVVCQIRPLGRA
ncbi:MAG: hypothetical protein LBE89_06460 [Helicobacteraceae bacterium]|jgi:hypothetical protein|nr:hypothetical protein [Helicobacteraceae bacterium]